MNKVISYFTLIIVLSTGFYACKKNDAPQFHREYFGLQQGRFVIYDVKEIKHDQALGQHDTITYQLKTYWGDTVIDNEGRVAREFHRYKRNTPADAWVYSDLWTGIIDGIHAELVEENQRTIKLVFAPTLNKSWNGNIYNQLFELDCYYDEIHADAVVNGINIDSSLIVEQVDYTTLIDTVRLYEMYAKNIGLIKKFYKNNAYQFSSSEVVNGYEIYMDYVTTGFE